MPVGEDYWHQWPGELYHGTTQDRLWSIMQHGLHPWDSDISGGSNYEKGNMPWLQPRPGHTYLSQNPEWAAQRAREGAEIGNTKPIVLKIDPSHLQAQNINPDEDDMFRYVPGAPSAFVNSPAPPEDLQGNTLGEYAEQHGWGQHPSDTERSINDQRAIAHKGVIPPHAITPGIYDVNMDEPAPREFKWSPIEWPQTASLRFATVTPWEHGTHGKGLYFPETGVVRTWRDDGLTHLDILNEDENAGNQIAHHLIIRPNGTVRDQGAMNRSYEDVEGDTEGLQRALHELDPRLRLDSPSDWDFNNVGPTEVMETEPSSIGRGEEGGKDSPTLQTGGDFAGSL